MRRWALAAAIVLVCAVLQGISVLLAPRRSVSRPMPRMTELGLVLLEEESGLYVLGVIDGSLAGDAGIRPGDYLTSAHGTPLTATSQLEELLSAQEDGASVPLTLNRHEQTVTVNLSFR